MKTIYNVIFALASISYAGSTLGSHCAPLSQSTNQNADLTALSLEQLMDIEITSLGKKPENLSDVAAAAYVITSEDINRSGVTNIADALQMAPGVHVSKLNSHAWAVSARGFNGFFANKLLVLIDGRNVYSSTFGGVYWDQQDLLLEDIERIEVIRGPAASIWGANSMNGVINIITRCSRDTQGTYLTAGAGKEDRGFVGARHGFTVGDDVYVRAYAKAHNHDGYEDDLATRDAWRTQQSGFRSDFKTNVDNEFTISGDIYQQTNDTYDSINFASVEEDVDGANLNFKWSHQFSEHSYMTLQSYVDHTHRKSSVADIDVDTFDIDFQHNINWNQNNLFSWGLGYRHISDDIKPTASISFTPASDDFALKSGFIQNETAFFDRRVRLTFGTKLENNQYTGTELQPNIRAIWDVNEDLSLWSALSHAVHTPSRAFTSVNSTVVSSPFLLIQAVGRKELDSEKVDIIEFGARGNIGDKVTWDATTYYGEYTDLVDTETITTLGVPVLIEIKGTNYASAISKGVELALNWQARDNIRIKSAWTYQSLDAKSPADPAFVTDLEGRNPEFIWTIRPSIDVRDDLKLDFWLRYVDDTTNSITGDIDDYLTLDARVAWQFNPDVELSLTAQNINKSEYTQFGADGNNFHATEVERNIYAQIKWHMK